MKLDKIENIVKNILEKDIKARSDDMYLYYTLCTYYKGINEQAFYVIFNDINYRKRCGYPAFESVSRARRKIQAENRYLKPPKEVQDARTNKEADYINYAIGGYNPTFKGFIDNIN